MQYMDGTAPLGSLASYILS